ADHVEGTGVDVFFALQDGTDGDRRAASRDASDGPRVASAALLFRHGRVSAKDSVRVRFHAAQRRGGLLTGHLRGGRRGRRDGGGRGGVGGRIGRGVAGFTLSGGLQSAVLSGRQGASRSRGSAHIVCAGAGRKGEG